MDKRITVLFLIAAAAILLVEPKKNRAKRQSEPVPELYNETTTTPAPNRIGIQPNDTDLCPYVKLSKSGRERIPDFLAICDRDTTKYCILKDWICDGEQDCFDNMDEDGCPKDDIVEHTEPRPRKYRKQKE